MQDLRLVGLSEDSEHVLLADDQGGRYRLPLDHALRSAVRHERPRPAGDDTPTSLSPREVQALIRAGASAEEVAELSGWTIEKVHKYEGPIIAEREHVASLATAVRLRSRGSTSTMLSSRVAERLHARGVDASAASWDAWRGAEGPWTLQLSFPAGGRLREARWHFDVVARTVSPADDEARWLSEDDDTAPEEAVLPRGPRVFDLESEGGIDAPDESERAADRADDHVDDRAVDRAADRLPAPSEAPHAAPERPATSHGAADRSEPPSTGGADHEGAYEVGSPGMYLHVGTRGHDADEDDQMVESMRQRSRASRRRRSAPRSPSSQDPLPGTQAAPAEPTIELVREDLAADDIARAVVDQPLEDASTVPDDQAVEVEVDEVMIEEGVPDLGTDAPHPADELPALEPDVSDTAGDADGSVDDSVDVAVVSSPGPAAAAAGPEHVPGQVTLPELDAPTPAAHLDPELAERATSPVPDPDQPARKADAIPEAKQAPASDTAATAEAESKAEDQPADKDEAADQGEARPTGRAARRATQQRRRSGRTSVPSWDDVMFGSKKPDAD